MPRSSVDIERLEGDPYSLRCAADDFRSLASDLDTAWTATSQLGQITDGTSWQGEAFAVYRTKVEENPKPSDITNAQNNLHRVADAVNTLASRISDCQAEIDWCRQRIDGLSIPQDGDIPDDLRPQVETINNDAIVARDNYAAHLREAGEVFAEVADLTLHYDPPGFWDSVGNAFGDAFDWVDNFALGVIDGVRGLVQAAYMIVSLSTLWARPWDWDDALATAQMLWAAFQADRMGFLLNVGKAVIDWETMSTDFPRWVGQLVPMLVIAVATGGAGTAATGLARAAAIASRTSRLTRVTGSTLNTLSRGAQRVDDFANVPARVMRSGPAPVRSALTTYNTVSDLPGQAAASVWRALTGRNSGHDPVTPDPTPLPPTNTNNLTTNTGDPNSGDPATNTGGTPNGDPTTTNTTDPNTTNAGDPSTDGTPDSDATGDPNTTNTPDGGGTGDPTPTNTTDPNTTTGEPNTGGAPDPPTTGHPTTNTPDGGGTGDPTTTNAGDPTTNATADGGDSTGDPGTTSAADPGANGAPDTSGTADSNAADTNDDVTGGTAGDPGVADTGTYAGNTGDGGSADTPGSSDLPERRGGDANGDRGDHAGDGITNGGESSDADTTADPTADTTTATSDVDGPDDSPDDVGAPSTTPDASTTSAGTPANSSDTASTTQTGNTAPTTDDGSTASAGDSSAPTPSAGGNGASDQPAGVGADPEHRPLDPDQLRPFQPDHSVLDGRDHHPDRTADDIRNTVPFDPDLHNTSDQHVDEDPPAASDNPNDLDESELVPAGVAAAPTTVTRRTSSGPGGRGSSGRGPDDPHAPGHDPRVPGGSGAGGGSEPSGPGGGDDTRAPRGGGPGRPPGSHDPGHDPNRAVDETEDDAICPWCNGHGLIPDKDDPDGVRVCPLCGGTGRVRMTTDRGHDPSTGAVGGNGHDPSPGSMGDSVARHTSGEEPGSRGNPDDPPDEGNPNGPSDAGQARGPVRPAGDQDPAGPDGASSGGPGGRGGTGRPGGPGDTSEDPPNPGDDDESPDDDSGESSRPDSSTSDSTDTPADSDRIQALREAAERKPQAARERFASSRIDPDALFDLLHDPDCEFRPGHPDREAREYRRDVDPRAWSDPFTVESPPPHDPEYRRLERPLSMQTFLDWHADIGNRARSETLPPLDRLRLVLEIRSTFERLLVERPSALPEELRSYLERGLGTNADPTVRGVELSDGRSPRGWRPSNPNRYDWMRSVHPQPGEPVIACAVRAALILAGETHRPGRWENELINLSARPGARRDEVTCPPLQARVFFTQRLLELGRNSQVIVWCCDQDGRAVTVLNGWNRDIDGVDDIDFGDASIAAAGAFTRRQYHSYEYLEIPGPDGPEGRDSPDQPDQSPDTSPNSSQPDGNVDTRSGRHPAEQEPGSSGSSGDHGDLSQDHADEPNRMVNTGDPDARHAPDGSDAPSSPGNADGGNPRDQGEVGRTSGPVRPGDARGPAGPDGAGSGGTDRPGGPGRPGGPRTPDGPGGPDGNDPSDNEPNQPYGGDDAAHIPPDPGRAYHENPNDLLNLPEFQMEHSWVNEYRWPDQDGRAQDECDRADEYRERRYPRDLLNGPEFQPPSRVEENLLNWRDDWQARWDTAPERDVRRLELEFRSSVESLVAECPSELDRLSPAVRSDFVRDLGPSAEPPDRGPEQGDGRSHPVLWAPWDPDWYRWLSGINPHGLRTPEDCALETLRHLADETGDPLPDDLVDLQDYMQQHGDAAVSYTDGPLQARQSISQRLGRGARGVVVCRGSDGRPDDLLIAVNPNRDGSAEPDRTVNFLNGHEGAPGAFTQEDHVYASFTFLEIPRPGGPGGRGGPDLPDAPPDTASGPVTADHHDADGNGNPVNGSTATNSGLDRPIAGDSDPSDGEDKLSETTTGQSHASDDVLDRQDPRHPDPRTGTGPEHRPLVGDGTTDGSGGDVRPFQPDDALDPHVGDGSAADDSPDELNDAELVPPTAPSAPTAVTRHSLRGPGGRDSSARGPRVPSGRGSSGADGGTFGGPAGRHGPDSPETPGERGDPGGPNDSGRGRAGHTRGPTGSAGEHVPARPGGTGSGGPGVPGGRGPSGPGGPRTPDRPGSPGGGPADDDSGAANGDDRDTSANADPGTPANGRRDDPGGSDGGPDERHRGSDGSGWPAREPSQWADVADPRIADNPRIAAHFCGERGSTDQLGRERRQTAAFVSNNGRTPPTIANRPDVRDDHANAVRFNRNDHHAEELLVDNGDLRDAVQDAIDEALRTGERVTVRLVINRSPCGPDGCGTTIADYVTYDLPRQLRQPDGVSDADWQRALRNVDIEVHAPHAYEGDAGATNTATLLDLEDAGVRVNVYQPGPGVFRPGGNQRGGRGGAGGEALHDSMRHLDEYRRHNGEVPVHWTDVADFSDRGPDGPDARSGGRDRRDDRDGGRDRSRTHRRPARAARPRTHRGGSAGSAASHHTQPDDRADAVETRPTEGEASRPDQAHDPVPRVPPVDPATIPAETVLNAFRRWDPDDYRWAEQIDPDGTGTPYDRARAFADRRTGREPSATAGSEERIETAEELERLYGVRFEDVGSIPYAADDQITRLLLAWGEGAQGFVRCLRADGSDHVFNVEHRDDDPGHVQLVDVGRMGPGSLHHIRTGPGGLFRSDPDTLYVGFQFMHIPGTGRPGQGEDHNGPDEGTAGPERPTDGPDGDSDDPDVPGCRGEPDGPSDPAGGRRPGDAGDPGHARGPARPAGADGPASPEGTGSDGPGGGGRGGRGRSGGAGTPDNPDSPGDPDDSGEQANNEDLDPQSPAWDGGYMLNVTAYNEHHSPDWTTRPPRLVPRQDVIRAVRREFPYVRDIYRPGASPADCAHAMVRRVAGDTTAVAEPRRRPLSRADLEALHGGRFEEVGQTERRAYTEIYMRLGMHMRPGSHASVQGIIHYQWPDGGPSCYFNVVRRADTLWFPDAYSGDLPLAGVVGRFELLVVRRTFEPDSSSVELREHYDVEDLWAPLGRTEPFDPGLHGTGDPEESLP